MNAHRLSLSSIAVLDALVVATQAPDWTELVGHLAAPHRWLAAVGPDAAASELASAALWLAAGWLAVGLLALAASSLPGIPGRIGRRLARQVLPRALYRLAAGAAGMGVLIAPVAVGAAATTGSG